VRCALAALFVAVLQPIIDSVGVGWAFTILGALCMLSVVFYWVEKTYGRSWRLKRNFNNDVPDLEMETGDTVEIGGAER
jgi:hypothetical protein